MHFIAPGQAHAFELVSEGSAGRQDAGFLYAALDPRQHRVVEAVGQVLPVDVSGHLQHHGDRGSIRPGSLECQHGFSCVSLVSPAQLLQARVINIHGKGIRPSDGNMTPV